MEPEKKATEAFVRWLKAHPTTPLLKHVTLQCDFIELQGWLIDLAKITHAKVDSGHIMLAQLGGTTLIFENKEAAQHLVPGANQMEPETFEALAAYLRARFNPSPVDQGSGRPPTSEDAHEDSDK